MLPQHFHYSSYSLIYTAFVPVLLIILCKKKKKAIRKRKWGTSLEERSKMMDKSERLPDAIEIQDDLPEVDTQCSVLSDAVLEKTQTTEEDTGLQPESGGAVPQPGKPAGPRKIRVNKNVLERIKDKSTKSISREKQTENGDPTMPEKPEPFDKNTIDMMESEDDENNPGRQKLKNMASNENKSLEQSKETKIPPKESKPPKAPTPTQNNKERSKMVPPPPPPLPPPPPKETAKEKAQKEKSQREKSQREKSQKEKSQKEKSQKEKSKREKSQREKSQKEKSQKEKSRMEKSQKEKEKSQKDKEKSQKDKEKSQKDKDKSQKGSKKSSKSSKDAKKELGKSKEKSQRGREKNSNERSNRSKKSADKQTTITVSTTFSKTGGVTSKFEPVSVEPTLPPERVPSVLTAQTRSKAQISVGTPPTPN